MKRLFAAAAAASAALALAGCETATPYQPLGAPGTHASGGYSDQQIEANRWTVSFSGNDLTSRQTVERYLLYRAAELTQQQGYDWFTTVDRNTERKSDYVGFDDPLYAGWGGYWGPRWGLFRRGYGWGYGYGGFGPGFGPGLGGWGGSVDLQQVSRYTATAEIIMGRGPKPPEDRRAFTAQAVLEHLRGAIQYPGQPARP
jgi:hypothetical protein